MLVLIEWLTVVDSGWAYLVGVAAILLLWLLVAVPLGAVERRRLKIIDRAVADLGHGHSPAPHGLRWLRIRVAERATWHEVGYAAVFTTVLSLGNVAIVVGAFGLLFAPAGAVLVLLLDGGLKAEPGADAATLAAAAAVWLMLVPLTAYLTTAVAGVQAGFARLLLTPKDAELAVQMRELTRSRTRLLDAFEAERSRIERDLHDGAQPRLVALTMTLGLAELSLAGVGGDTPRLVAAARQEAEAALGELRELIHGIHPRVLTDRGIEAAVVELADRCPVPVAVRLDLPRRPHRAIEAVAYFAVSEALTNVAKHARAGWVEVTGRAGRDGLVIAVADDGVGGAGLNGGSGLQGLADRVAAVGGRLALTSPVGGPTRLQVELPWQAPGFP